ncbi:MAG: hypothetical protein LBQ66_12695 [Planctomycetaceae bacterium]|nr:hypothetical protein [Planctomycetaceae bacterium]
MPMRIPPSLFSACSARRKRYSPRKPGGRLPTLRCRYVPRMRNAESVKLGCSFRIPNSTFHIPHSEFHCRGGTLDALMFG